MIIISKCSKLAQKDNKARHQWVGKEIHWEQCKKFIFDHTNKWYMHNLDFVLEYDTHKLLWVVCCLLIGFDGISTLVVYLMPNPFYTNNQFYFKQFSLACLSKTLLFQAIQFSLTVLIQTIQFNISIDFVYTQLNVKAVLY